MKNLRTKLGGVGNAAQDESLDWSGLNFEKLEEAWRSDPGNAEQSQLQRSMAGRYGDIMNFIESDRFWPPSAPAKTKFMPAMKEVLARLPDEIFARVEHEVSFVLQGPTPYLLAVNARAPEDPDPRDQNVVKKRGVDTIVLFHPCWELSHNGLIGLIAHEIAHSFVQGGDYENDEQVVNELARVWGFEKELTLMNSDREKLRSHSGK